MQFLTTIIVKLNDISQWFYHLYLECFYAYYIPNAVAMLFYGLSQFFASLAWQFYSFNNWVNDITSKVANILSISQITAYFQTWINYATWAWYWTTNALTNVAGIIDVWWMSVQYTVLSWIDDAKQWAQVQINTLENTLAYILAWWNEFQPKIPSIDEILSWFTDWWGRILANIISWGALTGNQISTLMDSKIRDWLPFYDELAVLWGDIKLFFTDPLQWLYDKAEEFMDRFW